VRRDFFSLLNEPFRIPTISFVGFSGFLFLVFGSTLLGFMIQVRAQRALSATLCGLLCLLEAPFSAFFAFIFLNDKLSFVQWGGAFLIFISAALAVKIHSE
jgi:drug/metabolite transporter (DMT)-like permease